MTTNAVMDDVVRQLEEQLKKNPEAVHQALAKAYGEDDVNKLFIQSIDGLAATAISLTKGFADVGVTVEKFDVKGYRNSKKEALPKYKPEWDGHAKKFRDLMFESREFARFTLTQIEMYRTTMLPMLLKSGVSDQEKLENIDYFLSAGQALITKEKPDLETSEKKAAAISAGFSDLVLKVRSFDVRLQQAVDDAKIGMEKEVTDAKTKLDKLKADLEAAELKRNGLAIGSGAGAAVGVVGGTAFACLGGMAATGVLAPIAAIAAVIGALAFLGCGVAAAVAQLKEIADLKGKVASAQTEYDAAISRQTDLLEKIAPEVNNASITIGSIAEQLGTLAQIWDHIHGDAQTVRIRLNDALNSKAPAIFKKGTIDLATATYNKLEVGLTAYSVNFDRAKLKKD